MSFSRSKRTLFVTAHPDDAEVLFGHAIQSSDAHVVVASDGEASSVDLVGRRFCPGWEAAD